ncbi:tripartite ATP-independent transporter DctP family solute receptor [Kushneria sinocarnis]|uniref:Tripartite ATP-independent transporter DctP family solute receptor n=1 Tax=Kushneria sinocarnis TaxID=595502 RepID=A0A420WWA8_9GAMM|nr:TRAP transporter substrate-binding protein [Kushneria sinocarnis]RKR03395.1 tripartite ATP-independent transporter DctP family solute receptor [Kushneria sinocarnis]
MSSARTGRRPQPLRSRLTPLALTAVGLMSGLLSSQALAVDSVTLRVGHALNEDHVVARSYRHMADELEQLSDGSMHLRIFPNGQMGSTQDMLGQMQNGALDLVHASASNLESFDDIYSVFNLPYLFPSQADFKKVVFGPIGEEIMQSTREKGFFAIGAYVAGYRSFYASKPIRTPADLEGMKIRVQSSPTTIRMIKLMGGSPTPIAFSEVYSALQQGVVDGAENNVPSYVQTRHAELARYFSEDQHTSVPDFLTIATSTWNRLSDEQQQILQKAVADSEAYQQKLWDKVNQQAREQAKEMGAQFIEVDKDAFRKAVQPLYEEYRQQSGHAELLERIRDAEQDDDQPQG